MSGVVFTVGDLKDYFYCKRILFYRYVLRVKVKPTYKMIVGRRKHSLEGIRAIIKRFENISSRVLKFRYFESERLGLRTVVDILLLFDDKVELVELKAGKIGRSRMDDKYKAQLAAQALIIEDELNTRVEKVRVVSIDEGEEFFVKFVNYHREMVRNAVSEMRKIVLDEFYPEGPFSKNQCFECDYFKVCYGVL